MTTEATPREVGSHAGLGLAPERDGLALACAAAREAQELAAKYADEVLELRAEVARLHATLGKAPPKLRTGGRWALTGARLIVESNHPAGMTTHRELTDKERADWCAWLASMLKA